MSIFKRKPKAEKVEKAAPEKGKKGSKADAAKQTPVQPPVQQPYKPTHAASDAVRKPAAGTGSGLSQDAAEYAQGGASFQHSMAQNGNPSFSHAGMRPVVTGTSPLPAHRGFSGGFNAMQRNNSAEVFTTDPDAPPMPRSSTSELGQITPRNGPGRQSSGYFSQPRDNAAGFDSPMLGNPKMALAARDRGYVNPHTSTDSGYESTSHSRAPSEQFNWQDRPHLPRDSSGFLPELSLSEELSKDPAFSEASFGGDEPADRPITATRQPESVLKNGRGYFSQLDPSNDAKAVKYSKSSRSTQKQTRFEQTSIPRSQEERLQLQRSASSQYSQSIHLNEAVQEVRPESATLPPPKSSVAARTSTPAAMAYEEPKPAFSAPVRHSTPPPQRHSEPHSQFAPQARTSVPVATREQEQPAPPVRFASPPPQQNHSSYNPIDRVMSPSLNSSQPPIGSLSGFRVNKRGKILDEEGEIIGELIEGDIMDCVRHRCNGYGEVLDDYGRVVGRVQAMEHTMDSPAMRVASPGPSPAPVLQQQNYFAPQTQEPPQRSHTPSGNRRRESAASQREVFTPAWQRPSQNDPGSMAWELRDHIANANSQSHQVIAPTEYPGNVTAVELDASGTQSDEEEQEEEVTPIFDYSEVFMPVPIVPPRSARRSETPSPPVEKSQWAASELIQPALRTPAKRAVQEEAAQAPSRHVSAPPAPRQPLVQQQTQRQSQGSAAPLGPMLGPERPDPAQMVQQSQPAVSKPTPAPAPAMTQPFMTPSQTQPEPPQQSTTTSTSEQQMQARRALLRSPSDNSMTDLAKSYSRPSMSPVPEDTDAPSVTPSQERSPALFSYKGAIPAADGPTSNTALAPSRLAGAKSPPLPNFPRQAFTGGLPGPSPFSPMNSAQYSSAGGLSARGTPPRQFTSGVPGPRAMPGFQSKGSLNAPLKRSPLSSHEITPPESDQGSADGDKTIGVASGMHSRQPSLRSMRSMQSTINTGKPRTYFTHGGRVAVGKGELPPSQAAQEPQKESAPSVSNMSTISKKKSRFSFGLGGKKGQAVAAH